MSLEGLPKEDQALVRRCVEAAAASAYGPATRSIMGADTSELEAMLRCWPSADGNPDWEWIVNEALVNAWGYPLADEARRRLFGAPPEEIRRVHDAWRRSLGRPTGGRYADYMQWPPTAGETGTGGGDDPPRA
jgi:hypothetical protein